MKKLLEKQQQQYDDDVMDSSESEEDDLEDSLDRQLIAYIPGKLKCQADTTSNHRNEVNENENKEEIKCENNEEEIKSEEQSVRKRPKQDSLSPSTPPQIKKQKRSNVATELSPRESTDNNHNIGRAHRTRKQPRLYDPQMCAASEWQSDFQARKSLDNSGRAGRTRKQPILYDPQVCAASEWQSDFHVKKALKSELEDSSASEDEEEHNNGNKKAEDDFLIESKEETYTPLMSSKASKKKLGDNSLWCDFCRDDTSISLCCFCGCRVCFSKRDEKNLLLCDNCDAEYHIYCLRPRLKEIPKDKWYCPECRDSMMDSKSSPEQTKNESKLLFSREEEKEKKSKSLVVRVKTKLLSKKMWILLHMSFCKQSLETYL